MYGYAFVEDLNLEIYAMHFLIVDLAIKSRTVNKYNFKEPGGYLASASQIALTNQVALLESLSTIFSSVLERLNVVPAQPS